MPLQADTPAPVTKSVEEHAKSAKPYGVPPIFEDFQEVEGKGDDNFMREFLNMLATLGLLIALILSVTWVLKRMLNTRIQQMNSKSVIKILERRSLTPKSAIYLLDIQGKGFIIAESHSGITTLGTMELQAEDAERDAGTGAIATNSPAFDQLLQQKKDGK